MSDTDFFQWFVLAILAVWVTALSVHTLAVGDLAKAVSQKVRDIINHLNTNPNA